MRAIMEAGTESVEWVRQEFARADLSDKRLDRRLMKTAGNYSHGSAYSSPERAIWMATRGLTPWLAMVCR